MKGDNRLVTVKMLKAVLTQAFTDFGREMRDFVRQEISASETRIKKEVNEQISTATTNILEGVGELLDNGIHPQLDDHEKRIVKLEAIPKGS